MPAIINFLQQTGFYMFGQDGNGKCLIMIAISFILMYLAIVKGFEPLLLLPISFGMLCTNLPGADMFHEILFAGGHVHWDLFGGTPVTASFIAEMSESGVSDAVLAPYFQQLLASAQEAFGADTIQQVASEVMAAAGGTKGYCNRYCGRGQLFGLLGGRFGLSRRKDIPKWMKSKAFRYGFLAFFFAMFFLPFMIKRLSCLNQTFQEIFSTHF